MASWRLCSSCRSEIAFQQIYWECSVSTCARVAKTGLFFCSVGCWEAHLPTMRHREAWAVEKRAPTEQAWRQQRLEEERAEARAEGHGGGGASGGGAGGGGAGGSGASGASRPAQPAMMTRAQAETPRRIVTRDAPGGATADALSSVGVDDDVLVVVSKLKKYVKARSGMNTSDNVVSVLSEHLRRICDLAIRKAAEEGRKTVLDRDFKAIL